MSEDNKNNVNSNKLSGDISACTNLDITRTPNVTLSAYDNRTLENVYQIFRNVVECSLFQSICNVTGIPARETIIIFVFIIVLAIVLYYADIIYITSTKNTLFICRPWDLVAQVW